MPPTSGALAPNSRLMGLKFMQRRQGQQQSSPAQPSPNQPSPAQPQPPQLQQAAVQRPTAGTEAAAAGAASASGPTASVLPSPAEWTLDIGRSSGDSASGGSSAQKQRLHVVQDDDGAAPADDVSALLSFRSGRRSFGKFNPRLEKRLSDIGTNQRAAQEERARAAREEEERLRQQGEQAELLARVEAQEAIEKANSVSDAELAQNFAARYGKYIPQPAETQHPPVVDHPVHVSDVPSGVKRSMPSGHGSGAPKKARGR